MILVYITNPDKKTALKVARHLLAKKLIACGNIFPAESLYMWQSKKRRPKNLCFWPKLLINILQPFKKRSLKFIPIKFPVL